jgi:hypothetical protein
MGIARAHARQRGRREGVRQPSMTGLQAAGALTSEALGALAARARGWEPAHCRWVRVHQKSYTDSAGMSAPHSRAPCTHALLAMNTTPVGRGTGG